MKTRFFLIAWFLLFTSLAFSQKQKKNSVKYIGEGILSVGTHTNIPIGSQNKSNSSLDTSAYYGIDMAYINTPQAFYVDTILVRILYSKKYYAIQDDTNNWVKWTMGYQIVGAYRMIENLERGDKLELKSKKPDYDRRGYPGYTIKTIGYLTIYKQPFPDYYEVWNSKVLDEK